MDIDKGFMGLVGSGKYLLSLGKAQWPQFGNDVVGGGEYLALTCS